MKNKVFINIGFPILATTTAKIIDIASPASDVGSYLAIYPSCICFLGLPEDILAFLALEREKIESVARLDGAVLTEAHKIFRIRICHPEIDVRGSPHTRLPVPFVCVQTRLRSVYAQHCYYFCKIAEVTRTYTRIIPNFLRLRVKK